VPSLLFIVTCQFICYGNMITEPLSNNGRLAPLFRLLGSVYRTVAWQWKLGSDSTTAAFRRHVTKGLGTSDINFLMLRKFRKSGQYNLRATLPLHASYFSDIEIYKDFSMWDPIEYFLLYIPQNVHFCVGGRNLVYNFQSVNNIVKFRSC
jgi:hypothetical protein